MRLEGQSKLGYYPTPALTLQFIKTFLRWPRGTISSPTTGDKIATGWPQAAQIIRTLDPCCGAGEAIAELTNGFGVAHGIELSDARAQAAEDAIPHVIHTGYEYAVLTPGTFSLVLLNPPYDGENATGGGKRMEETFLCDLPTTEVLVNGGTLIYIIPHARINDRIARHLAGWYTDVKCFVLPEGEYEVFKQVVIFGTRRDYATPDGAEVKNVLAWKDAQCITGWTVQEQLDEVTGNPVEPCTVAALVPQSPRGKAKKVRVPVLAPLPALAAGNGEYLVPASPEKGTGGRPFKFQYTAVTDEDFAREAEECAARLDASRAWADLIPPLEPPTLEPAMTPKKGHIAMQVTGGLLGTNRVTDLNGNALLLKGHIEKYYVSTESEVEDPEDDSLRKIEMEQRLRAVLATLTEAGQLASTNDPHDIAGLLEKHVGQLAEIVQGRNVPLYNMKPEPWEWAVFEPLSKGRQLPGRDETGLTEFQKHLTVALGRMCRKYGAGFINAEMGSGKTTLSIALAEYLRVADERGGRKQTAYPALVVGPGIVTGKENWPKEIPEVTPGATSRVIAVGARPLPKPIRLGAYLREVLKVAVNENDFTAGASFSSMLAAIRQQARKQKVELTDAVLFALNDALEQAEKNPPIKRKAAKKANLLDGRCAGFAWLGLNPPRDENSEDDLLGKYSLAQFIAEYRAGQLPEKSFAVVSYETAKLGSGRMPAMTTRNVLVTEMDDDGEPYKVIRKYMACPTCGAVVSEKYDADSGAPTTPVSPQYAEQFVGLKRRYCQAPRPHRVWNADKAKHEIQTKDSDGHAHVCGAPLFENTALRRIPASEYARKQAQGFFGLCLVDEIHQAQAKGTGVGAALTSLTNAARYVVGLTGTLLNGYSTSIFWCTPVTGHSF